MSLDADLATLRAFAPASTARVEAEIARLREQLEAWRRDGERAEAAEGELARLRRERDRWEDRAGAAEQCVDDLRRALREEQQATDDSATQRYRAEAAEREVARLREGLREIVGDSYNLITQGESPSQRRQPSARHIYDRARALLAEDGAEVIF